MGPIALWLSVAAWGAPAQDLLPSAPSGVTLVPREIGWAGGSRVQVEQRLHGLRVDRAPWVAAVAPDGSLRRSVGRIVVPVARTDASLSVDQAREVVRRGLGNRRVRFTGAEHVYVEVGEMPRLAWAVDGVLLRPWLTFRTWVDAGSGEVLGGDITSRTARGHVYPTNPSISEVEEVELAGLISEERLSGTYAHATSCDVWVIEDSLFGRNDCEMAGTHAAPDGNGDYLFAPDPASTDDPFAEVQVYYHTDAMAAWMDQRYGFRLARPLDVIVNFPMANAFYGDFDGDGHPDLSFGHVPETGVDFGYDADVVYHEFGHAIVGELAGSLPFLRADAYGMEWVAGSVNEGAADIWSMVLTGDPLLGEYAGSGFDREAVRDLERDRRCPDDLRGEVHADGEILASLGWNLIEDAQVGPESTADLLYGAIPFWGPDITWPRVGTSLLDSAADLLDAGAIDLAAHDAITAHLEASGILDCGRVVSMESGEIFDMFLLNAGLHGDLARIPMGVQFSVEVPEEAVSLSFFVDEVVGHEGLGWSLYGRVAEPVVHRSTEVAALGLGFATAEDFDWMVDGERSGSVVLTPDGDPPLVPGETQYFAMSSRNLGGIDLLDFQFGRAVLRVEVETGGPAAGGGERPGGCGCATGGPSGTWILLPTLLLLRRRQQ